jgi:Tol biopolymer transport system component
MRMSVVPSFRLSVQLALLTALALPAAAQQRRTMTPDDVLAMKNVGDAQVSPDGKWVAYVVSAADLKESVTNTDVWLVPAAGGSPLRLTSSPKADGQPRWSPDGKSLAFVSAREERTQIWLISPFGGEAEKLTDSKSGIQSFQWSPDGSKIAYVALRDQTPEEERRIKEKDDAQEVDKNFRKTRIWVFTVATKQATELVKDDLQMGDVQWSPDGTQLAYSTTPTPKADDGSRSDIWIVPVAGGAPRKLIENPGPDAAPRWSPDGRTIAFLSRSNDRQTTGQTNLRLIPADGGTARDVLTGFLYQPGPVTWSPDGRTLTFTAVTRTTVQLFSVPVSGGTPRQLSDTRGVMSGASWSKDGTVLAFVRSDPQNPGDARRARRGAFSPSADRSESVVGMRSDAVKSSAEQRRDGDRRGAHLSGRLSGGPEVSHHGLHSRRTLRRLAGELPRELGQLRPRLGRQGLGVLLPQRARLLGLRREVPAQQRA